MVITLAIILVITNIFLPYSECDCVGSIAQVEFEALQALFVSTNGNRWKWNNSYAVSTVWSFPNALTVPCSQQWQGLSCLASIQNSSECSIIEIQLVNFNLKGQIPSEIGYLSKLEILNLAVNYLNGSLTHELGDLSSIHELYLFENSLSGFIPTELCLLPLLQILSLNTNNLIGSIPTSFGQLPTLEFLALFSNHLTGTIPTEFGLLSLLEMLSLSGNSLIGTIPTEIGQLTDIQGLIVYDNCLIGSIPTELGQLIATQVLWLGENDLTGTIPTELGQMSGMHYLYLYGNNLFGSLPIELCELFALEGLYLYDNRLTGSLPVQLNQLSRLSELLVDLNFFTGSITSFTYMNSLQLCDLQFNYFSGSLPTFSTAIEFITLSTNFFTSSISNAFADGTNQLQTLAISDNYLTGTVPAYFVNMKSLQSVNISTNLFSQSIGFFIIDGGNSSLQSIDASNNQFSGSLPPLFFSQQSLQTVLLYENCFSGTIPRDLCGSTSLQSLFLDSLTGNCGSLLPQSLQKIMHATMPKRLMIGSIPSCIWDMDGLQLLRLSGNGLTGSLGEMPNNSTLSVLILSSNSLTGSIPASWQTSGQWSQLDLSSNKLSGLLSSDFVIASDSTLLDFTVNRLSGLLPSAFQDTAQPLNVLNGNLFQCSATSIPQQDPAHGWYVCGADNFDNALEFAVVAIGLSFLSLLVISYKYRWLQSGLGLNVKILNMIRSDVIHLVFVASLQAIVTVVLYSTFKMTYTLQQYSTITKQYTWTPTAAYLHDWGPVLLVCLLLLMTGLLWQAREVTVVSSIESHSHCSMFWYQWPVPTLLSILNWCKYIAVHIANAVIVISVNVAYVNAVLEGVSNVNLFAIQCCLSVFKLTWNWLFVPRLAVVGGCQTSDRLFMTSFALIGGPFISTFITSANCFRNLFVGESPVDGSASVVVYSCYNSCSTSCTLAGCNSTCSSQCSFSDPGTVVLSLTPPWNYSYQCASSLLTNYIPVMVVTYAIAGAIVPMLELVYFCWSVDIFRCLRRIHLVTAIEKKLRSTIYVADRGHALQLQPNGTIIKQNRVRLQYLLQIVVLLTFGIASPLLSVLIALGAGIQCARWLVGVGRILDLLHADDASRLQVLEALELCEIHKQRIEMRIVLVFAGIFWGFFVFDMIGDVYGSLLGGLSFIFPCAVCLFVIVAGEQSLVEVVGSRIRHMSSVVGTEMTSIDPVTHNRSQSGNDGCVSDNPIDVKLISKSDAI